MTVLFLLDNTCMRNKDYYYIVCNNDHLSIRSNRCFTYTIISVDEV